MNLPIFATLASLFTEAGNEFKKLLQPWALISAAVFLGLGLALFYAPLRAAAPAWKAWESWPTAWQLLIATVALFSLAYLINTVSGSFLGVANGRFLRDSPLAGRALLARQRRRFDALMATALGDEKPAADRAFYRLAYEFPARDVLAPTRLGNIQAAAAAYSMNQYGAHLDTLWPALALTLGEEDKTLLEQINGEQTSMTFLTTLGVLLGGLALAAAPVGLAGGSRLWFVAPVALALAAYGLYRAAAVHALGWGRLTRAALDLYLEETGKKLGLRPLSGGERANARDRWEDVSIWLAYGGLKLDDRRVIVPRFEPGWYAAPEAATPTTLTCSAGVSATVRVGERPPAALTVSPTAARLPGPVYEVVVLAARAPETSAGAAVPAGGGFVMVSDSRVPMVPPLAAAVPGILHRPDGQPAPVSPIISRHETGPDALLWPLPNLARHGGVALSYTLAPETWLRAGPGVELLSVAAAESDAANRLRVRLRYVGATAGPVVLFAELVGRERAGRRFLWRQVDPASPTGFTPGEPTYHVAARRAGWTIANVSPGSTLLLRITLAAHGVK